MSHMSHYELETGTRPPDWTEPDRAGPPDDRPRPRRFSGSQSVARPLSMVSSTQSTLLSLVAPDNGVAAAARTHIRLARTGWQQGAVPNPVPGVCSVFAYRPRSRGGSGYLFRGSDTQKAIPAAGTMVTRNLGTKQTTSANRPPVYVCRLKPVDVAFSSGSDRKRLSN